MIGGYGERFCKARVAFVSAREASICFMTKAPKCQCESNEEPAHSRVSTARGGVEKEKISPVVAYGASAAKKLTPWSSCKTTRASQLGTTARLSSDSPAVLTM